MANASSHHYELLDFGDGRKLERFSGVVLDRPSPAAEGLRKSRAELWASATARFEGRTGEGVWKPSSAKWMPDEWVFEHDRVASFRLGLDALPSGQVGVFPEQFENWDWIAKQVRRLQQSAEAGGLFRVLNLFA